MTRFGRGVWIGAVAGCCAWLLGSWAAMWGVLCALLAVGAAFAWEDHDRLMRRRGLLGDRRAKSGYAAGFSGVGRKAPPDLEWPSDRW